jgi:hypothetical protein
MYNDVDFETELERANLEIERLAEDNLFLNVRIAGAVELARSYGMHEDPEVKMWVIDQMVKTLMPSDTVYKTWANNTEYWSTGTCP